MMQLFLISEKLDIRAKAEYDKKKGVFTVLKGSKVSATVNHKGTFRGAASIEKSRSQGTVVDCVVMKDATFKSASTAANFVTGRSTNGLLAWKDKNGVSLKKILAAEE